METKFKIGNKVSFSKKVLTSRTAILIGGTQDQCEGIIKGIDQGVLRLKLREMENHVYIYSCEAKLCCNKYFNIKVFNRLFKNEK